MTKNSEKAQKRKLRSKVDGEGNIKSGIIQLKKSDHIFLLFTTARGFGRMSIDGFYFQFFWRGEKRTRVWMEK